MFLSAENGISGESAGNRILLTVPLIIAIHLCILIPIRIYAAVPARAGQILAHARSWPIVHQRSVMAWMLTSVAVLLIAAAVLHLA